VRKQFIGVQSGAAAEVSAGDWLDLERIAEIEITSEDPGWPIESALVGGDGPGWRASAAGEQLVRILFDEPQRITRIRLVFEEPEAQRTQEFVVRWLPERDGPAREVVRQQWTFHGPGATREVEDYEADLAGVRVLELAIVPDVSGGTARASLRSLQVA
jgi:hypothetical protein